MLALVGAHFAFSNHAQAPAEKYRRVDVDSFADASRVWIEFADSANFGAGFRGSDMTRDCGQIYQNGCAVAYVSYNGRVWQGRAKDWKPGQLPIFDPSV